MRYMHEEHAHVHALVCCICYVHLSASDSGAFEGLTVIVMRLFVVVMTKRTHGVACSRNSRKAVRTGYILCTVLSITVQTSDSVLSKV